MAYGREALRDRIAVSFVEADVEIGFNLIDLAGQERTRADPALISRVLHDADDVLRDIDDRLARLGDGDRACFEPLVAELRRELEEAKSRRVSGAE